MSFSFLIEIHRSQKSLRRGAQFTFQISTVYKKRLGGVHILQPRPDNREVRIVSLVCWHPFNFVLRHDKEVVASAPVAVQSRNL